MEKAGAFYLHLPIFCIGEEHASFSPKQTFLKYWTLVKVDNKNKRTSLLRTKMLYTRVYQIGFFNVNNFANF